MAWQEIIGLISGALTSASLFPQVYRLFKRKSARDISYVFNFLFIIGIACWVSYGIVLNLPSVIFWNCVSLISAFAMLYAKMKWGKV